MTIMMMLTFRITRDRRNESQYCPFIHKLTSLFYKPINEASKTSNIIKSHTMRTVSEWWTTYPPSKSAEFVSGIGWFLIFSKYSASFENGYYFLNDIICNQFKLATSGSGTRQLKVTYSDWHLIADNVHLHKRVYVIGRWPQTRLACSHISCHKTAGIS